MVSEPGSECLNVTPATTERSGSNQVARSATSRTRGELEDQANDSENLPDALGLAYVVLEASSTTF